MSKDDGDKKALNNLTDYLSKLKETAAKTKPTESKKTKGSKKIKPVHNAKLDEWLSKKGLLSDAAETNKQNDKNAVRASNRLKNNETLKNHKTLDVKIKNTKSVTIKKNKLKNSPAADKQSKRKSLKLNDSSDSCELPTFNIIKKNSKLSKKIREKKALFKKYGVTLPSVDEILKEKQDLEECRHKIENFNPINEDSLELPFSEEVFQSPVKEKGLDCKEVSFTQLEHYLQKHSDFLSDICNGKTENSRHKTYYDENHKVSALSTKDLTYNTSTILFSYEQIDFLMGKLNKQFDPEDTKTKYIFQVLLPELCQRIFEETYNMNHEEAVKYLDDRPILD